MRRFTTFYLDISNMDALLPRGNGYIAVMQSGEHIELDQHEGQTLLAMLHEAFDEHMKRKQSAEVTLDKILVSVKDAMNRTPFENGEDLFKE